MAADLIGESEVTDPHADDQYRAAIRQHASKGRLVLVEGA
jgi:hypothetical protein